MSDLGNLFTQASTALEMRFGHNIQRGFVYVPDNLDARKVPAAEGRERLGSIIIEWWF